jgi:hypothetical protein
MVRLVMKKDFDDSVLETGSVCLGYKEIEMFFNIGPPVSGGDGIICKLDGEVYSNYTENLVHDLEAYEIFPIEKDNTVKLVMKEDFDDSVLETGSVCLGYKEIELLFNLGPFPGGDDCIICKLDGEIGVTNGNNLIHDLEAYDVIPSERKNKAFKLVMKEDFDDCILETGSVCLGYKEIKPLFNLGPFPGGGDCIICRLDGEIDTINGADLDHDLEAYDVIQSEMKNKAIKLLMKDDFDDSVLETGSVCLGYKEIELLFNLGPFPGGGDCIICKLDGEIDVTNGNDLIHDLEAYDVT